MRPSSVPSAMSGAAMRWMSSTEYFSRMPFGIRSSSMSGGDALGASATDD
jgi:hypothetical protein